MTSENKFTPRAEEALRLAQEAAEEMGHGYVGCEHILLGLMREEDGIAHRVMQEYGMTEDMICTVLERSVGKGLSGAAPSQGLTPRAKSAVELAVSEAMRMGAGYIGTEHLLMGLLREGNNMAIRVLDTVGIDPKKMYSSVVQKINEGPRAAAGAFPPPIGTTARRARPSPSSPVTSPRPPVRASWIRSSAGTRKFSGSSRSSPAAPRTIPA